MWLSRARCENCDFKLDASPALDTIAEQAKEHRHTTKGPDFPQGHSVLVEDKKQGN